MNYSNETEIYVLKDIKDITSLCEKVPYLSLTTAKSVLDYLPLPLTIVHDKYYVDKVYRNAYYSYFSNKHFEIPRNCQRLAFFAGCYKYDNFFDAANKGVQEALQKAFVGTMVIKPTPIEHSNCTMGKTLFDPNKMKISPCYVRTTNFEVSILGIEFTIDAFPFTGQDGETMTCTETCIWSLLEYFGNRYPDYRTILPNDIITKLNNISQERILPSRGLTFLQVSNLLKSFGFEPRLYSRKSYEAQKKVLTKSQKNDSLYLFRKMFHYYVESAIPFAVGIGDTVHEGHSIVCIGHGKSDYSLKDLHFQNIGCLKIVDSVDFFNSYVVIDDNQFPYRLEKFDQFSKNSQMNVQFFAVPLYKHVYLEANGAMKIVKNFLSIFATDISNMLKGMELLRFYAEPLVTRFFLTSSKNFKGFRIKNSNVFEEKWMYSQIKFPKFVWVCELSTYFTYTKEKQVIGEIVLDATSSDYSNLNSIIAVRLGQYFGYRDPPQATDVIFERLEYFRQNFTKKYSMFINNLKKGGFADDNS